MAAMNPHVAHMGQLPQWLLESRHRLDLGLQSSERLVFLEHLDVGQRNCTPERIADVAVAMEEGLETFMLPKKSLVDFFGSERGSQGHVAAGHTFTDGHEIRRHTFVLAREHLF